VCASLMGVLEQRTLQVLPLAPLVALFPVHRRLVGDAAPLPEPCLAGEVGVQGHELALSFEELDALQDGFDQAQGLLLGGAGRQHAPPDVCFGHAKQRRPAHILEGTLPRERAVNVSLLCDGMQCFVHVLRSDRDRRGPLTP
jgi:hypothetical protein